MARGGPAARARLNASLAPSCVQAPHQLPKHMQLGTPTNRPASATATATTTAATTTTTTAATAARPPAHLEGVHGACAHNLARRVDRQRAKLHRAGRCQRAEVAVPAGRVQQWVGGWVMVVVQQGGAAGGQGGGVCERAPQGLRLGRPAAVGRACPAAAPARALRLARAPAAPPCCSSPHAAHPGPPSHRLT